MPLPFRRKVVPDWVPSGMSYFTLPSMVGISSSAPSTACGKVMGASQRTLVPSRRKSSWGRTVMVTRRSPAGPPFFPALPWPRMEMVCPLSMPAGTLAWIFRRRRTTPLPRQSGHGLLMTRPRPPQREQGAVEAKTPMGVCRRVCTTPLPPQSGQVSGEVPGAAPLPWHVSQFS